MSLLPLEIYLENNAEKFALFPSSENFINKYKSVKDWMCVNVYVHIGAGLSAKDGQIYSSHSTKHFNDVIRNAGDLLGINSEGSWPSKIVAPISPYETYILLLSILLHDSGNMFGREGHEKRASLILHKMGALAGARFEKELIAKIARAHGGETATGNKDTISTLTNDDGIGSIPVRSKLLAAITRFADEISEDHTRAASFALENNGIPKENIIFHKYADCIKLVRVDLPDNSISIHYVIDQNDVLKEFKEGGAKSPYLIDEIVYRFTSVRLTNRTKSIG